VARRHADSSGASPSVSDLVPDACLHVWRKRDRFQGTDDGQTLSLCRAWVGRIVWRLGQNGRRDRRAQGRPPARQPTPSVEMRQAKQRERVRAALESLPGATARAVVRLPFFEGVSLREVARRLGLSYDSVRERYRASVRLLERGLELLP
jgi:RNA polymerase sigma factor (sigma-70 family)